VSRAAKKLYFEREFQQAGKNSKKLGVYLKKLFMGRNLLKKYSKSMFMAI
jgi:hypothetical protein